VDRAPLVGTGDAGALRVLLCAAKNVDPAREPVARRVRNEQGGAGREEAPDPRLVLELDLWVLVPRRR